MKSFSLNQLQRHEVIVLLTKCDCIIGSYALVARALRGDSRKVNFEGGISNE